MRAFCGQILAGLAASLFAVTPLPAGEIAAPAAVPVAPTPNVAPAGALYIVDYVSVRTARGITGFEPGRAVRFVDVDTKTGRWLVTDGQYQVTVLPRQVTRDARMAATLQRQEQAEQQAMQAAREANLLTQKRYEAALRRIEFDRDVEMAGLVRPPPRTPTDIANAHWNPHLYDHPYDLRGDPYTPGHAVIPRVAGPHSVPGSLGVKSNGYGFY